MAVKEINKPHSKIGVSNYTFFPITADDIATGKTTYGEAVTLPGTVEIAPTDSGSTSTFDADNGAYEVDSYVEKWVMKLQTLIYRPRLTQCGEVRNL